MPPPNRIAFLTGLYSFLNVHTPSLHSCTLTFSASSNIVFISYPLPSGPWISRVWPLLICENSFVPFPAIRYTILSLSSSILHILIGLGRSLEPSFEYTDINWPGLASFAIFSVLSHISYTPSARQAVLIMAAFSLYDILILISAHAFRILVVCRVRAGTYQYPCFYQQSQYTTFPLHIVYFILP